MIRWSSRKKEEERKERKKEEEDIFCTVHFVRRKFFLTFVFYLSVSCIQYTLRIYILLHIKKHYFKIVESLQCILNGDNSFKGVSFISEVKLKALSWILLIKLFEQNIHKSRQSLNWPLMKDLKEISFWKGLRILAILVKALSFLSVFLEIRFPCSSNLSSLLIVIHKISFTEVFSSFNFLYTKISSTDRFYPIHIKLHSPELRAM